MRWAQQWQRHPLPSLWLQWRKRKLIVINCWLHLWMCVVHRMPMPRGTLWHLLWSTRGLSTSSQHSSTWQQPTSIHCSVSKAELLSHWNWTLRWFCEHSWLSVIMNPARSVEVSTSSTALQDNSRILATPSAFTLNGHFPPGNNGLSRVIAGCSECFELG